MIYSNESQTLNYTLIGARPQDSWRGQNSSYALRYKLARQGNRSYQRDLPNNIGHGLWALTTENYRVMPIPLHYTIALFLFIADSFPDDPSAASIDVTALITQAQRGDRGAVGALYQAYSQRIFRYIVFRVPTTADAEDLTAEVFVGMVKGLPNYQVTGAPFEAWLYRIAASKVVDFYRQTSRRSQTELSDNLRDSTPLPEEQILQDQAFDHLRAAMRQLPDDYQSILLLRFVERKSHEEVAALLGSTASAVKSAQHRALVRLSELLGSDHKVRHYLRGSSRGKS